MITSETYNIDNRTIWELITMINFRDLEYTDYDNRGTFNCDYLRDLEYLNYYNMGTFNCDYLRDLKYTD